MDQQVGVSEVTLRVWQIKQRENKVGIIVQAHANTLPTANVHYNADVVILP